MIKPKTYDKLSSNRSDNRESINGASYDENLFGQKIDSTPYDDVGIGNKKINDVGIDENSSRIDLDNDKVVQIQSPLYVAKVTNTRSRGKKRV